MKILGFVGGIDAERSALARRLGRRLESGGRVAIVEHDPDVASDRNGDSALTYHLNDDGPWTASGDDRTLSELLDRLSSECDYALVSGFPDADLDQVVLGGAPHEGTTVLDVPSAADIDLNDVVDVLADLEPYETLQSLVERAKRSPDAEKSGAIATFTGRVRARESDDDAPTTHLEFEKYEGVAEERFATIRQELEARDGVFEVLMHHRTGVIEYGEDIVFVVVLAGHRGEAFKTVSDGIDRLKAEVPIFKKETTVDEEFWVHDRS